MNLLHVIPYYAPAWAYGGSVRAAADLTRALAAEGHSVYVLTTDTLSPTERIRVRHEALAGVHVYRVPNLSNRLRGKINLSSPVGMARTAQALIEKHRIEVVHCHELRTIENLRVAPVANWLRVPAVVSPHGTLPYGTGRPIIKKTWDQLLGGRLLPRFDRVIALTQTEVEQARAIWYAHGLPAWCSIVPNGIHLSDFAHLPACEPFRARWKLGSGPVVLFLGRLHERKGLQYLIPAFAYAVTHIPDARLLIVGPDEGMLNTLKAQVSEYNLAGRVIFTGLLTGADKLAALAAADLFALPAVGEGFSMAVLEAMACGLPVLLTPGCNFPEVMDVGAGLVVERDAAALSAGLHTLLANQNRREQMGHAARQMIQVRYTWPQVAAQLVDVYQAVIERRKRR